MKKKLLLLLVLCSSLGFLSLVVPARSEWTAPSGGFPQGSGNMMIFDDGSGPNSARKGKLIFSGNSQSINVKPGQYIEGGLGGNKRITFGVNGISINSLGSPIQLSTKGLQLKTITNSGLVTPSAGTLVNEGGNIKYNADGTATGWRSLFTQNIWKQEANGISYEGALGGSGFQYFETVTVVGLDTNKSIASTIIPTAHANVIYCDDEGGVPCPPGGGGGGGGYTPPPGYYYGDRLSCDTNVTTRDCPNFISATGYALQTRKYDEYKENGVRKRAMYVYQQGSTTGEVKVGSSTVTRNLVVNGDLEVDNSYKLSFSSKKTFTTEMFSANSSGSGNSDTHEYIIADSTGRKDFSFCAIGYQWTNATPNSWCSVSYNAIDQKWVMTIGAWNGAKVKCKVNCF